MANLTGAVLVTLLLGTVSVQAAEKLVLDLDLDSDLLSLTHNIDGTLLRGREKTQGND